MGGRWQQQQQQQQQRWKKEEREWRQVQRGGTGRSLRCLMTFNGSVEGLRG